jgi:hypothetical protein
MINLNVINAGLRMFKRNIKVNLFGLPKYKGDVNQICKEIINICWNDKYQYFMTSKGNYTEYYCRDFGMVTKALLSLGYKDKVKKTLEFALFNFKRNNKITVMISKKGKCFDFPYYAPDSLAFLLHSLYELKDKSLIKKYNLFLEEQINVFENKVVQKNGLPKKDKFSSMRDYSIRESSCYDLCMIYLVQKYSKYLNLKNNLQSFNYKEIIMKYYWADNYFRDDLKSNNFSSDANILPFWTKLINDKKLFNQSLKYIVDNKLDLNFPIQYSNILNEKMHFFEIFVPDWERDKLWLHLGYLYIEVVLNYNKKLGSIYLNKYKGHIKKYENHLEVFEKCGKPYKSLFFYTSDSMIWAANYLWFNKKIN